MSAKHVEIVAASCPGVELPPRFDAKAGSALPILGK
jgi:hypothetical protein